MAVTSVVDVIQNGSTVSTEIIGTTKVVDVIQTATSTTVNNLSVPVVTVTGPSVVANAIASATAPPFPYEGQIWIDIS